MGRPLRLQFAYHLDDPLSNEITTLGRAEPTILIRNCHNVTYSKACSLDDLFGAGEQQLWYRKAERLRCLKIYHQLELGRLGDWQTGNLDAVKDLSDVHA